MSVLVYAKPRKAIQTWDIQSHGSLCTGSNKQMIVKLGCIEKKTSILQLRLCVRVIVKNCIAKSCLSEK